MESTVPTSTAAMAAAPPPPPAAPAAAPPTPAPVVARSSSTTALPAPFPSSDGGSSRPIAAGVLLVALAVAALVTARRRKRVSRHVEIVESASLGPKRSLVVARMGDELLLLGSSEGGITLLTTRPAPAPAGARAAPTADPVAAAPTPGRSFELILGESADDVDLRRKLAAGTVGSVR